MKSFTEYEPSDIDLKEAPNSLLIVAISLCALSMKPTDNEDTDDVSKRVLAMFMNMLSRSGYVITKSEVPDAFKF